MAERMTIDGACHCGAIRFEANINPDYVVLCHCTDCQTFSSAPYRASVPVKAENFRLEGQPTEYVKTGGSGARVAVAFCGSCGTALYSTAAAPAERTRLNLRLGWVRQRAELPPKRQGFCRSALPWAYDISDVEKVPEKR
jgi:hypothetical protein